MPEEKKADCELLEIKREDFDIVLKATVLEDWKDIQRCMSYFEYFDGWDEVATRECCILGKKRIFEPDETILGDGQGADNFVHFLVDGQADVIEHLVMQTYMKNGQKQYKLCDQQMIDLLNKVTDEQTEAAPAASSLFMGELGASLDASEHSSTRSEVTIQEAPQKISPEEEEERERLELEVERKRQAMRSSKNLEIRYIRVCVFNRLACFNLGENLKNRRIVARTRTECLLIPTYWLFQKNKANIWNRVQQYLNQRIPTTQQIFKNFLDDRKWVKYRRQLVSEIKSQVKRVTNNSIHNVPYSIRIREIIKYD